MGMLNSSMDLLEHDCCGGHQDYSVRCLSGSDQEFFLVSFNQNQISSLELMRGG